MITIAPWLGGANRLLDLASARPPRRANWSSDHLPLELDLGLVGDVLKMAAAASARAKVGAGRLDAVGRRLQHLHQASPGPAGVDSTISTRTLSPGMA